MVNEIENVNLRVQIGELIDRRWKVTKILGEGAFGAVYEVEDATNGKSYALKLEQNNLLDPSQNMLKLEVTVLRFLRNSGAKCCPGYESCGQNEKFNYVVMGLVGQNISSLKKKLPFKRFTLRSCLHIGMVSCRGIEEIHNIGFVHRDFKPANMAVGRPPNYRNVYVLDWGLCRRFVNEQGRMIPARRKAPYRGTPRYSSANSLAEKEQGRVDDMWSWV
uniref:Protein kinase domain-containing protein n=1 Tax=Romanomermis culicivorax TaxID=13658 RepID=A0A915KAS7_ROMCU